MQPSLCECFIQTNRTGSTTRCWFRCCMRRRRRWFRVCSVALYTRRWDETKIQARSFVLAEQPSSCKGKNQNRYVGIASFPFSSLLPNGTAPWARGGAYLGGICETLRERRRSHNRCERKLTTDAHDEAFGPEKVQAFTLKSTVGLCLLIEVGQFIKAPT